jgi:hypothetical protein
VEGLSLRPLGTVLVSDDFPDPDAGALTTASDGEHFSRGYADGKYDLQELDPTWNLTPVSQTSATFADTRLAVDMYFASDSPGQYAMLECRRVVSTDGETNYALLVSPDRGFRITRYDRGKVAVLADWRPTPAMARE